MPLIHRSRRRTPARRALLTAAAALLLLGALAPAGQAASKPPSQPDPIATPGTGALPTTTVPEELGQLLNPSNYDCKGHLSAGEAVPGDEDTQVQYRFGCSGPITGYSIAPKGGDTGFGDSAVVYDASGKIPITTDSFTCSGALPGLGFNCTGTAHGGYSKVVGQFGIGTPLCAEPRVDALLTVFLAGVDSKGSPTTAISGPFDLGRPHGCNPKKKPVAKKVAKKKTTRKAGH